MLVEELPTPCLLIEASRLKQNLEGMQARANAQGVHLRPHTKTHKSVALARRQVEVGAAGLTVAKPGEAEVYVAAGFDDVRLAYTVVGQEKHERLLRLMDAARISFCVDTPEAARAVSAFYAAHDRTAEVLVEIDCDYGRCGVPWKTPEAVDFTRYVASLPGLRLVGLLTHAGQSYKGPADEAETPEAALRRASNHERDVMLDVAVRLRNAGVRGTAPDGTPRDLEISIGSTPSMRYFENRTREGLTVTEIRPGNYIFNDAIQVGLSVAPLTACALTAMATVISKHRDRSGQERLFLDAGRKVFTSDTGHNTDGYGILLYSPRSMQPLPHAHLAGLSEEHGWVRVPGGATLDIGDRIRIVPNHACVAVNTQEVLYLVDGETVLETLTVDARGRVT